METSRAGRTEARESADAAVAGVRAWLRSFAAAVRAADTEGARGLFAEDVVAFGTAATHVQGLDRLVREQWRVTWEATRGFEFAWDDAHVAARGDVAWVAAPWSSTGFDARGRPFPRRGRATIVLRREARGWRAVHTHFSLDPVPDAGA
jgi:ketosteroid isomerase-like protein